MKGDSVTAFYRATCECEYGVVLVPLDGSPVKCPGCDAIYRAVINIYAQKGTSLADHQATAKR